MKTTNIYLLIDPITENVRYVGKSNNVLQRYSAHLNNARKHQTHKLNWINSLKNKGLKPIIVVIDEVPLEEWQFWEMYWISQMKTYGFNLINYTLGGEGTTFGNQTSFKKGHVPWNKGTAKTKICIVCNKEFKSYPSSVQKTCSIECSKQIKNKSATEFKKGHIPWNTNKGGYLLKSAKTVLQIDKETNKIINEFHSCKEAAIAVGCSVANIRNNCLGHSKSAMGYKWKFKDEKTQKHTPSE
jgi:hypothetical protein